MRAFLRKAGVIDDPGHHWPLLLHRWQHMVAYFIEQGFVTPGCLGHQMVQGLTHRLDVLRIQAGRDRLNALALTG
jgi:hypothetical protein